MDTDGERLFLEGIRLFNEREFFDCHDAWEEVWTNCQGPERDFLQGMIQAAVALFHFENGNLGGAMRMHRSAQKYLAGYPPLYERIELALFLSDFAKCFEELASAENPFAEGIPLKEEWIPRIQFVADKEQ